MRRKMEMENSFIRVLHMSIACWMTCGGKEWDAYLSGITRNLIIFLLLLLLLSKTSKECVAAAMLTGRTFLGSERFTDIQINRMLPITRRKSSKETKRNVN